jgi:anti-anti-sigma factor
MPIEIQPQNGGHICRISGALCIWEAAAIWGQLRPLLADALPLTLDFTAVEECDAAGIQILCQIQRATDKLGNHLKVAGISSAMHKVLSHAGLDAFKPFTPEGNI